MIEIKTKIHDKFSIEFKVGFVAEPDAGEHNFAINTWIFVPNSLDINPGTYGKDQFYRDVKSKVRLITPVFLMKDIAGGDAVPARNLNAAFDRVAADPSQANIAGYEYHVKMFAAIFKSSLRNAADRIRETAGKDDLRRLCGLYAEEAKAVVAAYRRIWEESAVTDIPDAVRNSYNFGDEFISHIAEHYSFRVLNMIDSSPFAAELEGPRRRISDLIYAETAYKREHGYVVISESDPVSNRSIVFRHGILKKFVESHLYIKLDKKQDGKATREVYYSLAAGIAMIFATVIAFSFQRTYGAMSIPLFVALVLSYMLKDRIKELTRRYFAHNLRHRYFDNKATINIRENEVGWLKEGVDFITDDKAPREVMELRNRSVLVEAENRIFDEKIILYRKLVYLDSVMLRENSDYPLSGINDILRLHITRFTSKMDDPKVPLRRLNEDGDVEVIFTEKVYYLNIVMQFHYGEQLEYRHFRAVVSRDGIMEIQDNN